MTEGRLPRIAVLLPCYNEEAAIGGVVQGFAAALPGAAIYVYDNNSRDKTMAVAREAGAIVRSEPRQGKGNVVRRMFADIDADIYVLADGDGTYDAQSAPGMVSRLIAEGLDLVSGRRVPKSETASRAGHDFGNFVLTRLTEVLFGAQVGDMLTGYRVMSRRFVKSLPFTAQGFAIETELVVHAIRLMVPMTSLDTPYFQRAAGTQSKLRTFRDGFVILGTILTLVREERPLAFFSFWFAVLVALSIGLGIPVVAEFFRTGLVPRLPTAVLAMGLMLLGFLSLGCGLILDTVSRGRWELKRLAYLALPGIQARH
ncbi:MAG: glycosyltransferase [Alphaproteobacteria bacterium]|nr:glycosyltransferase [Alphaproteobacteria bacterium]